MSVSRHPVALRLEQRVGRGTRLLATVMSLPLIDGIFPALIIAGALSSPLGIVETGLLIFGGSATVAVILADFDGTPKECARAVLLVGLPLIAVAALEAAIAPTLKDLLNLVIFERFAALVILAIAASTASARVGHYLPRPAVIVGLGLIASLNPAGLEVTFVSDPGLILRGATAAAVGVAFGLAIALAGPQLRRWVDLDRFRFGSAVSLGLLPLSIIGLPFGEYAPLGALALTALFAIEPPADEREESEEQEIPENPGTVERAPWL